MLLKTYCLEVTGEFACFTRPEMKVERVSYDVITPSAGRAIFEAILWKPVIRWHVRRIEVLNPIRWISLRRNEVGAIVATRPVQAVMRSGKGNLGLYVDEERQQRAGLFLRDVAYRIHAEMELLPLPDHDDPPPKFLEMFERRAEKGQCINQPYLGCREFAADVRLAAPAPRVRSPIPETRDLGWMLFDLDFAEDPVAPPPIFFRARLDAGVVNVPDRDSGDLRK